jgi:hypothetical protein
MIEVRYNKKNKDEVNGVTVMVLVGVDFDSINIKDVTNEWTKHRAH